MNKLLKKIVTKIDTIFCTRLLRCMDAAADLRICGRSLTGYVPSIFRDDKKGIGGTGSESTHYIMLRRIFSHVMLTASDALMDVGCGKGRVLAFLIGQKCPCPLYGVEHNEEVGKIAAQWTARYEQAHIIIGDAFRQDYDRYTVLTLARSFLPATFLTFVEQLEATLTHPVTLVYWFDQQSGHLLNGRPGWHMLMRETIARLHGIKIAVWPQSYSIWVYDPDKRGKGGA